MTDLVAENDRLRAELAEERRLRIEADKTALGLQRLMSIDPRGNALAKIQQVLDELDELGI